MRDFVGGGADNLDFSGYTYEELRAAVYGVREEAVRVAANEWADLKRRINERVGTLHVAIAKLASVWNSPAGRHALDAFRSQRDWMAELARVAAVNEAHLDDVQAVRIAAVNGMRVLDTLPGGPVAPGARPRPAPAPGPAPASGIWLEPAALDWRQPQAATIANRLYGQLAIAAASLAVPPTVLEEISDPVDPVAQRSAQQGTGAGTPGRSFVADRTSGSDSPSFQVRPLTVGVNDVSPGGGGPARRSAAALHTWGARGARDRGPKQGDHVGNWPVGTGSGAARQPTSTDPPGRVLGWGSRPASTAPEMPPLGPPATGDPAGESSGPARRKRRYERAEADTFVDRRFGNAAGGSLPTPAQHIDFAPLPGTVGNQKHKPAADDPHGWDVDTRPSPEGFPEKLETFTRRDGVTFEVRRKRSGL